MLRSRSVNKPLGLCVLLAVAALGCKHKEPPAPPPPEVSVTAVVQRDVPVVSEWIGTLEGSVNADIRPKVEGYVLRQTYKEGQLVRRNDPLFEIDPRQFRAALEQARGTLARAEAQLAKANKDVERFTPLVVQKAVSQQELDNALAAERDGRGGVAAARAAVDQANLNLQWTRVKSPIEGIVGIATGSAWGLHWHLIVGVSIAAAVVVSVAAFRSDRFEWVGDTCTVFIMTVF